jgi:Phospholipid-translocating P-type ATPase C-terminal
MSNSWTLITWVIIPGSSLVMFLWIVIYSFFESFDFVHEVQRLCGDFTFWLTVILTVAIALRETLYYQLFSYLTQLLSSARLCQVCQNVIRA